MRCQFAQEFRALIPVMVEEVLNKLGHTPSLRCLPSHAKTSASKSLRLLFLGALPDTLLTLNNIQDEGASLRVELQDSLGSRVEVGPEASVKIKIVVLDGEFEVEDRDDWTDQDFDRNVAQPSKDKGPLLKGKCEIRLSEGVASVTDIAFTDNSKSMRNGKFRLGARVVRGLPSGVEIKDAVSEAFRVKERRMKSYRKHKSQSLEDGTHCLKNIGKTLCQRLAHEQIHAVKDLLQLYHSDAKRLQSELINKMRLKAYDKRAELPRISTLINLTSLPAESPYTEDSPKRPDLKSLKLQMKEKPLCLLFLAGNPQTSTEHPDGTAADTTKTMPSTIPAISQNGEGQDICSSIPNQTDQGQQEKLLSFLDQTGQHISLTRAAAIAEVVRPPKSQGLPSLDLQPSDGAPYQGSAGSISQRNVQYPDAAPADTAATTPCENLSIDKRGGGQDVCSHTLNHSDQDEEDDRISYYQLYNFSLSPNDLYPNHQCSDQFALGSMDGTQAMVHSANGSDYPMSWSNVGSDNLATCPFALHSMNGIEATVHIENSTEYLLSQRSDDLSIDLFTLGPTDGTKAMICCPNAAEDPMSQHNVGSDDLGADLFTLGPVRGTQATVNSTNAGHVTEDLMSQSTVRSDYLGVNLSTLASMNGTQAMVHNANMGVGLMSHNNVGPDNLGTDLFTLASMNGARPMVDSANVAENPMSQNNLGSDKLVTDSFALGSMDGTQAMVHSANTGRDWMSQNNIGSHNLGTDIYILGSVNGAQVMEHSANPSEDPMSQSNLGVDKLGSDLFALDSMNGTQDMERCTNAAGDPMSQRNGGSKRQRTDTTAACFCIYHYLLMLQAKQMTWEI